MSGAMPDRSTGAVEPMLAASDHGDATFLLMVRKEPRTQMENGGSMTAKVLSLTRFTDRGLTAGGGVRPGARCGWRVRGLRFHAKPELVGTSARRAGRSIRLDRLGQRLTSRYGRDNCVQAGGIDSGP